MNRIASTALLAGLLAALAPESANAEVIINIQQIGIDVIATGSGTIDTTDLSTRSGNSQAALLFPTTALLRVGPTEGTQDLFAVSITGPSSFGPGTKAFTASSGSGDLFGVAGGAHLLYLPDGYSSGASLSATDTYSNTNIDDLGLIAGTYTYTFGTGAHADSLIVNIGNPASVPEPSSLVLMSLGGISGLCYAWRRRRADVAARTP